MSYESQAALGRDPVFVGRCNAAFTQQALVFKDDTRGDIAALADTLLANRVMVANGNVPTAFVELVAASPGFAAAVDTPSGMDQSQVSDDDILAAVQVNWPTVAALFFDDTGNPKV